MNTLISSTGLQATPTSASNLINYNEQANIKELNELMPLPILMYPAEILSEVMPDFDFENPIYDAKQLEADMIKTMLANRGMGLSANQTGIRTRMFVMGNSENASGFFNPIVVEADDLVSDDEGCLSFPGIYTKVKRPNKIRVMWQNSSGEMLKAEVEGITAKCFLHELDHLNGVVFKDRVSSLKWNMAVKKAKKQKGKF